VPSTVQRHWRRCGTSDAEEDLLTLLCLIWRAGVGFCELELGRLASESCREATLVREFDRSGGWVLFGLQAVAVGFFAAVC
jgi:hypothetical protein